MDFKGGDPMRPRHGWKNTRAFSLMEYAVGTAVMVGLLALFVATSTGVLDRSLSATETQMARPDSLDSLVGVVEVEPVARALALSAEPIPSAYTNTPFTFSFASRLTLPPGTDPASLVWTLSGDPLPVGIVFDPATATLSGTYTSTATLPVALVIQVTDGSATVAQSYSWQARQMGLFLSTATPPSPAFNQPYTFDLVPLLDNPANIPLGSLTWSTTAGTLPLGLSLDSSSGLVSGAYTGLESVATPVTFQVQGGAYTGVQTYVFSPVGEGLRLEPAAPFAFNANTVNPFSASPLLVRDPAIPAASVVWTLQPEVDGLPVPWPQGLSASGADVVGTYTGLDNAVIDLRTTATFGVVSTSQLYVLELQGLAVSLADTALPPVRANVFYDVSMVDRLALGAGWVAGDVTWSIVAGSLPAGVSLNPTTGRVSGINTSLEDAAINVTIQAALPNGRTDTASYAFNLIGAGAVANPQTLPPVVFGVPYSFDLRNTLTTRNPFDFSTLSWVVSGAPLPAGISLNPSTGVLSGTYTGSANASLAILVVASDAENVSATAVHTLPVEGLAPFQVSMGTTHACALDIYGGAYCWGTYNADGRLGSPAYTANLLTPGRIADAVVGRTFTSIEAGSSIACGVRSDGTGWCWGLNTNGQLGIGSLASQSAPVQFNATGMGSIAQFAVGATNVCALSESGEVWCAGANTQGRNGNNLTSGNATTPVRVVTTSMTESVVELEAGQSSFCARTVSGQAWCWGTGSAGQMGNATSTSSNPVPRRVVFSSMGPVQDIAVGGTHACAIDASGAVWCWGAFANNRLGDVFTANQTSPVLATQASMGTGFSQVVAGSLSTCAVKSATGAVWCWGSNTSGQLGAGMATTITTSLPVQVTTTLMGTGITRLSMGPLGLSVCATKPSVRASWCWGSGAGGLMGNNTASGNNTTPVATTWPPLP
jgi:alpha-tubulin suppressor-like RCC1 family protein